MEMSHPGLPGIWIWIIFLVMLIQVIHLLVVDGTIALSRYSFSLSKLKVIGPVMKWLAVRPWPLIILKLLVLGVFFLVIAAGLFGSVIAERNFATVLTWNVWWAGLVIWVFFFSSSWCAVCPWDALATWLVRRSWWRRRQTAGTLNLMVPRWLRNVWPAFFLFLVLTWLELGLGITADPYLTALLALAMIVMATLSLSIFKGKAFCHYFCPVGRTIGFYSQLSVSELRPINQDLCADCSTLECYYGTEEIEPCHMNLVMGRLQQNTYCTSCGNCSMSCPDHNIAWRLRAPSQGAIEEARPHWDEAWFMLGLLALTSFHGLTMLPFFEEWISRVTVMIGSSAPILFSFTIVLLISLLIPWLLYSLSIWLLSLCSVRKIDYRRCFTSLAFASLPLAFGYHLAHNLNHLLREISGFWSVVINPFGTATEPLSMLEKHMRHMSILPAQDFLFMLQAGLMILGFWISLKVIQRRAKQLQIGPAWRLLPIIGFCFLINSLHLWYLMQPMTMRM